MLQETLDHLNKAQRRVDKIHWEEDLISEIDTTGYMEEQVDNKEAQPPPVPDKPVLRRQDTTLSEIGETQVPRWVDNTLSITQFRDIADDCNQDLGE